MTDAPQPFYYDRTGAPLTFEEWAEIRMVPTAVFVRKTIVQSKKTDNTPSHLVSTVWTGVPVDFIDGKPRIFETMVFTNGGTDPVSTQFYPDLDKAVLGHSLLVSNLVGKLEDPMIIEGTAKGFEGQYPTTP